MTLAERLAELETRRALYILAESKILQSGQSYEYGDRSRDEAKLADIRAAIKDIDRDINTLSLGNRIRVQRIVPRDI